MAEGIDSSVGPIACGGGLFTPSPMPRTSMRTRSQAAQAPQFSGFGDEDGVLSGRMAYRRMVHLESLVGELMDKMAGLQERQGILEGENSKLREKCNKLEGKLKDYEKDKDKGRIDEGKIKEMRNVWKQEQHQEQVNFREILSKQFEDQAKETVIKVIKEKHGLVRDAVEKKRCVVLFGVKEKKNPVRHVREKEEKEVAAKIVEAAQAEDKSMEAEIEEVQRMGKYQEGGQRPLRVRFRSQNSAEEVLAGAWRLSKCEDHKDVWIKRDMNNEERERTRELVKEAKEKNSLRSETEKEKFRWRVMDMKLRKWYIERKEGEH